jgi:uncharacterized protein
MSEVPFRALSLDGGGLRGVFAAACLAHLEAHSVRSIADYVDVIAGTSTGAIIALGLAAGLSGQDILDFYEQHGPTIFGRKRSIGERLFRPKYSNDALKSALKEVFGDRIMNDLLVPVCIPSYELCEGTPRVFKDDHHPHLHWGGTLPVWKVALASAAAPLYLPTVSVGSHDNHIDGGVWANNPVMVAITEGIRYFSRPIDEVIVVSLGTGTSVPRIAPRDFRGMGILDWVHGQRIVNVVFDAQSSSAHHAAKLLLGEDRYLRIDAELSSEVPLDDYSAATALIERGRNAGRTHKKAVDRLIFGYPPVKRND